MAGRETDLIEVVEVKVAVTEADAREHWVVLAVSAVGGDVEEGTLRALGFEDFRGGLVAEEELCAGEYRSYGLHFVQDLGGALIRDAKDQGSRQVAGGFFLAEGEDRGTGSVGNGVRVAEIGVAIFESMEGKEVKWAMGNEDQVFSIAEVRAQWGDQFRIESFEMALGGLEQGLRETLRVGFAHAEFGELETEEVQEMNHARENGDGLDLYGTARDDGGD